MNWAQRRVQRIRYLFKMALAEDTTPHEFALAVALGAFVSASPVPPVLGLRSFTTLGLAWAARLSKLVAFLASHLVVIPLWGLLVFWEIRIGCRILSRPMPPWGPTLDERVSVVRNALLACVLGGVLVAGVVAFAACLVVRPLVAAYQRRRALRSESPSPASSAAPDRTTP